MKDPEEDGGVKMYIVQSGDNLGSIAAKNKVSINTILWANDISNVDSIMPGDTLFILPVSGIKYVVKAGDNIDAIASKFKADKDKIIAFNTLPADGSLDVGQDITIPDGQVDTPKPVVKPTETINSTTGTSIIEKRQYANASGGTPEVTGGVTPKGKAGAGHSFPYGYCTWYVAQKRYVPWSGNAGAWLYNAKAGGYATGRAPRVGAIMVTTENRYYGHVALVEKVSGDTVTVSEMNYAGFAKRSTRTLSASSRAIKGFIY
jgi:surface antigen